MNGGAWGDARPVVACVGLSCRDHAWRVTRFPPVASRTAADAYRAEGGGPAATAAVAAARLGADARLWAVHGDDEDGRANAAELAAAGVDLRGCRAPAGARSFVSAVLIAPDGERFIFPYRGAQLADDPEAHDWAGLEGAGAVLVDARHPRLADRALAWAANRGVPSVGDWSDGRHPDLRARVDHLVASEEAAAEALRGQDADTDRGAGADPAARLASASRALGALRARPDQRVVVTLGPLGCIWDQHGTVWRQPAPHVTAVDSTGAGDAFHGAYAAAIAAGWPMPDAVRLATAVGALRCTGEGRAALPDLERARSLADALPPATLFAGPTPPSGGRA